MVHLDVHFDVLRKTADEEFRLLLRVADNRIVAAGTEELKDSRASWARRVP